MLPTINPAERDMRDTSVVRRKIRRRFMNSSGMRVFSMVQSYNSTRRKLDLVPRKRMVKIVDDPAYDIFRTGDGVKRISPPWRDTKPATRRLYVDGVAVNTSATDLDGDGAEAPAAEAPAAEAAADNGLGADGQPPATGTVGIGRSPPAQSRAQDTTAYGRTVAPDVHDSLLRHGKPTSVGMVYAEGGLGGLDGLITNLELSLYDMIKTLQDGFMIPWWAWKHSAGAAWRVIGNVSR